MTIRKVLLLLYINHTQQRNDMTHQFTSKSGKTFTAEKVGDRYLINGVAKAQKQFGYFLLVGAEAEKLCTALGAPATSRIQVVLDRAEYSRLVAEFAKEEEQALAASPIQYRIEDKTVNADGDIVPIGKKIIEYKIDADGNEHIIIVREYTNQEVDGMELTAETAVEVIEKVYAAREAKKQAEAEAAANAHHYEITYHCDHEMWNGVRMS